MEQSWQLSSFDLFSLKMTIKGAWIYKTAPDIERMRTALTQLGGLYPILSGCYDENSKSIVYDADAPSRLTLETADLHQYTADQLCGNDALAWSLVRPYDNKAFKQGRNIPFGATLGMLADGAILYVQCAHAAMDGHTFYQLIRQWAMLYQGQTVEAMRVDQSLLPSANTYSKAETLQRVQQKGWPKIGLRQVAKMLVNMVRNNAIKKTVTIEVSQAEITQLKAQAQASTHAVLSAIAMQRLAQRLPHCNRLKMIQVADLRGRFGGIDSRFFGNFSQAMPLGANFDPQQDLTKLAADIDHHCRAALDSPELEEVVTLSICASQYSLPYFFFDASDMNCSHPGTIYINNQLKLKACQIDWSHGLPLYAFANDLPDMVKFWQPVPDGNIQIIYAGLAAKIMK